MRRGIGALLCALALGAAGLACAGEDEDGSATVAATAPETSTSAEPAQTGAVETGEAAPEGEDGGGAGVPLPDAAAKTATLTSARVATEVTVSGASDGTQTFRGEGAFDFERKAGHVTLDLEGADAAALPSTELVFEDYVVYYGLPEGILPGGMRWLRLDLQSLAESSSLDFGSLVQGVQADPSQYLLWLAALGPEADEIGAEEVRGVPTTHYRATVDLRRLETQAPEGQEAEWQSYVQSLASGLGTNEVPVEIWVDDEGYVRRMRQTYPVAGNDGALSTTVTTELYDFGVEVDVQVPPADQVASINDLIRP